ncbi:MAG: hypothetical protein GTN97_01715 [Nitrosopumilaceae archaeon]|nr:hypothetical protein [Nitrosopumilaceae archaeon]NIP09867.1 hypothetical protein [Nitrosopumilaceae archaeon]NIS94638.1 hypothetical protein [Nitrosopumilaceae archaeon]
MHNEKDPLYPINLSNYPKLFDFVLTAKGLLYFNEIKRKYFLQKEMTLDEYNKLRLMYVYYATSNKNIEEVSMWQKICQSLDEKGIYEKNMYASKADLINQNLITKNPEYVPGLYKTHIDFIKRK